MTREAPSDRSGVHTPKFRRQPPFTRLALFLNTASLYSLSYRHRYPFVPLPVLPRRRVAPSPSVRPGLAVTVPISSRLPPTFGDQIAVPKCPRQTRRLVGRPLSSPSSPCPRRVSRCFRRLRGGVARGGAGAKARVFKRVCAP